MLNLIESPFDVRATLQIHTSNRCCCYSLDCHSRSHSSAKPCARVSLPPHDMQGSGRSAHLAPAPGNTATTPHRHGTAPSQHSAFGSSIPTSSSASSAAASAALPAVPRFALPVGPALPYGTGAGGLGFTPRYKTPAKPLLLSSTSSSSSASLSSSASSSSLVQSSSFPSSTPAAAPGASPLVSMAALTLTPSQQHLQLQQAYAVHAGGAAVTPRRPLAQPQQQHYGPVALGSVFQYSGMQYVSAATPQSATSQVISSSSSSSCAPYDGT